MGLVTTVGQPAALHSYMLRTNLLQTTAVNGNLFSGIPYKNKIEMLSIHKCICSYDDAGLLQLFYL